MASIEQFVGSEMLPAFAKAARLEDEVTKASEELEVARAERIRVTGELFNCEQVLLKALDHSQRCTSARKQLQKQAASLRGQIAEVNQVSANFTSPLPTEHRPFIQRRSLRRFFS